MQPIPTDSPLFLPVSTGALLVGFLSFVAYSFIRLYKNRSYPDVVQPKATQRML